MSNKKEKKGGCIKGLIIFVIVAVLLVFLLIWLFDDDDNSDGYSDNYTEKSTVSEGSVTERQAISSIIDTSAVRSPRIQPLGNGEDVVTLFIYMNGSDLESESGEATTDLKEIIKGIKDNDKVNIIVQTMGTKEWGSSLGIASDHAQRYEVHSDGLKLVDDSLGQLDTTNANTLGDFIAWGKANYPANRNMLVFWDHGGGSVYGFGYDEWQDEDESLTIDEIQEGLKKGEVYFDFIGMDCCIMSTLETCCALYDFCDYTILSEDFESGLGWNYTGWISTLTGNSSVSTIDLGKEICDLFVSANVSDKEDGDDGILALIDQAMIKVLYVTWTDFVDSNLTTLTGTNYSRSLKPKKGGRASMLSYRLWADYEAANASGKAARRDFWDNIFGGDATLADYYEVDIMSAASSVSSEESEALSAAINAAMVYVAYTSGDANLTGISVSLPYGDEESYDQMKVIFKNIGMDSDYISNLEAFVDAEGYDDYYDYDEFDEEWDGWDDYEDDYDWGEWEYFLDDDEDYDFDCDFDCYDDYYYDWY